MRLRPCLCAFSFLAPLMEMVTSVEARHVEAVVVVVVAVKSDE